MSTSLPDQTPESRRADEARRSTKRVAITQSNYLPWKGYFDTLNAVDEFVLYDHVQYTRRDWRNRNLIKTPQGVQWLTVPVEVKGRFEQRIDEARIGEPGWGIKHLASMRHSYARAPFFDECAAPFHDVLASPPDLLTDLNEALIAVVCEMLGISTRISRSSDYELSGNRTDALVHLCRQVGATEYLTGPAAQSYLDESAFRSEGITVTYVDYSEYPAYPQLWGEFEHRVSIVDLLFNVGPDAAPSYMKSFET